MTEKPGNTLENVRHLSFSCSGRTFYAPYSSIREIIARPEIHKIPGAAGVILGLINYHGIPVAVADLAILLGLSFEPQEAGCVYVFDYSVKNSIKAAFSAGLFHGITGRVHKSAALDLPSLFYNSGIMQERPY